MALRDNEKDLLFCIKGLLSEDLDHAHAEEYDETSHHGEKAINSLRADFQTAVNTSLSAKEQPYFDRVSMAFSKTIWHKDFDDPAFIESMIKDMGKGLVPVKVQEKVVKIVEKLQKNKKGFKDSGAGDNFADVCDTTTSADDPKRKGLHSEPFLPGGPSPKK